jgi:hypothetical protein
VTIEGVNICMQILCILLCNPMTLQFDNVGHSMDWTMHFSTWESFRAKQATLQFLSKRAFHNSFEQHAPYLQLCNLHDSMPNSETTEVPERFWRFLIQLYSCYRNGRSMFVIQVCTLCLCQCCLGWKQMWPSNMHCSGFAGTQSRSFVSG